MQRHLAIVLGIRPDIIRASLVLNAIRVQKKHRITFIWSGQHYSDNLKDVFFRDLGVAPPEIELGATGSNDAEVSSDIIRKLYPVLEQLKPDAVMFLGDTNTVMGSLAAAQLNIPIVHFEGCMHSYDWRMPEEKYRSTIDGLADVIYTYFPEYKHQGIARGLNPKSIVMVGGNPIVEILDTYYTKQIEKFDARATPTFFAERGLSKGEYYLMTCHRRENVHIRPSFEAILRLIGHTDRTIYFPASYRTQKVLKEYGLTLSENVRMVDPIGYVEMLVLMVNSRGVITDSGTVVEETSVLQVPSLQMRKATERPQVYDVGSSVKFDPDCASEYDFDQLYAKFESLVGKTWPNPMGDGRASERITNDLLRRLDANDFRTHRREDYHLWTDRSYRDDGLAVSPQQHATEVDMSTERVTHA
jgi:UDP-N-acetylglucosamine 2-epimerase